MKGYTYADSDGTALATLLAGQRVRRTEVGTPVSTTDGDDAELGDDDGGADGGSDFLGGLDAETDVALGVTNDDNGLETSSLTGTGLLLDGLDLFGGEFKLANRSLNLQSSHSSLLSLPQESLSSKTSPASSFEGSGV